MWLNGHGLTAALLLVLPLMIYANTISARFGFRDDYSILREVNEEPGKVLKLCSSQARPLYGWMLESFFGQIDEIDELWAGRAVGALFIGGIAALIYLALIRLGWPSLSSALMSALMITLPAAQVDVSWAICWPHLMGGVFSLIAFMVAEKGGWPRRLGAGILITAGALFYQPHALFYVVPVAAGLVSHRPETLRWRIRWLALHLITVAAALVTAFLIVEGLYALNVVHPSHLVTIETQPLQKLLWFVTRPLLSALALFVLADDLFQGLSPGFVVLAAFVAMVILAGGWGELRRAGWREGAFWAVSFFALTIAASAPILVADEQWLKYRTIYPLTGVCLVFFMLGLQYLTRLKHGLGEPLIPATLAVLLTMAVPLASWKAYTLFALPQQLELSLLEEGLERLQPKRQVEVFVIKPDYEDAPAPGFFSDEFGTLSTNSDWAPKEILKLLLRERFPYLRDLRKRVSLGCGDRLPLRKYDVVIDMHRLRDLRAKVATEGYLLF
ncbi:MAG: glucosyltransferase domain-containing protein [Thermodesulfobacteriota bacterium]